MKITQEHLATVRWGSKTGYCMNGAETMARRHGIDLQAALAAGGIDEEVLLSTGNALCRRLVEHARAIEAARSEAGNGH